MSNNFTWAVAYMENYTSDGVVFTIHFTVNAEDGTYSSGAYGSLGLERGDALVPFADLTEATVVGWVKERLTAEKVTEIEAALQAQLDEQRQPTKSGGLPWS